MIKFKGLLKTMRKSNADFFASERLMSFHFGIFALYILANFGICIRTLIAFLNYDNWSNNYANDDSSSFCRDRITFVFFNGLTIITNCLMVCLFIYLSVKFSEPLEDYRSSFILLFQKADLCNVRTANEEFGRAQRYNKAWRDIDLIIFRELTRP